MSVAIFKPVFKRLQADPAKPVVYDKAATDKIIENWTAGAKPGPDQAAKQRWRDDRLAALAAFKRKQPKFEG